MTDKQIIIDGVDVSECGFINACDKKMKCVILQDDVCEVNPYCEGFNCYYKQLKRKEQECEELKKKNYELTEEVNIDRALFAEIDQLKSDNDSLKSELMQTSCYLEADKEIIDQLKGENDSLKSELMQIYCYLDADKETIDQLRTENEDLKKYKEVVDKLASMQVILTNENGAPQLYDNAKDLKLKQLSKTLTEIKEIAKPYNDMSGNCVIVNCFEDMYKILQKIKEVMPDEN